MVRTSLPKLITGFGLICGVVGSLGWGLPREMDAPHFLSHHPEVFLAIFFAGILLSSSGMLGCVWNFGARGLLILSACLFGAGIIAVPFVSVHGFTAGLILVAISSWILSLVLLGLSTVRLLSPIVQKRLRKWRH
jgi:hypothetical protein